MLGNEKVSPLSPDDNSSIINLQQFVCSVCGEDHETEHCAFLKSLTPVHDTQILSRARLTLPKGLSVTTLADGTPTIISNRRIENGTQFGPFQAPLSLDMHPGTSFPLKIFGKNTGQSYYLDTSDEESCNWMCLVASATTTKEQNLICYDIKESIYFTSTRDIQPGEQLCVWYAFYYGLKLQALPLTDDSTQEDGFYHLVNEEVEERLNRSGGASVEFGEDLLQTLAQHLPAHALGASGERDVWMCKLCGGQELNVASYARHLMAHYRQQEYDIKHPQCKICFKRFLGEKVLEKHIGKAHDCKSDGRVVSTLKFHRNVSQDKVDIEHEGLLVSLRSDEESNNDQVQSCREKNLRKDTLSVKFCTEKSKDKDLLCHDEKMSQDPNLRSMSFVLDRNESKDFTSKDSDIRGLTCVSDSGCVPPDSTSVTPKPSQSEGLRIVLPITSSESIIQNAKCPSSPSQPEVPHIVESKLEYSTNDVVLNDCDNAKSISDEGCNMSVGESLIFRSSIEPSVTAQLSFTRAHVENGQPVTFIMVDSSEVNEDEATQELNDSSITFIDDSNRKSSFQDCTSSHLQNSTSVEESGNSFTGQALQYNCDICQKSFSKCSYLYRHLRKHTGEFTCVTCLAVFARKENLKAHSCAQPKVWFPCLTCGKKFSAKKYLQRHSPIHTGEFACTACKRSFVSRLSLKVHRCLGSKVSHEVGVVSCFLCERVFDSESKLQSHLKVHSETSMLQRKPKCSMQSPKKFHSFQRLTDSKTRTLQSEMEAKEVLEKKKFICEVCGAIFKSSSSMKTHRFLHGERKFECGVCKKRFHRKDVLQEHLTVHQEASFPCQICGKKYKTKKSLYVHTLIHQGAKRFVCGVCHKEFFQKGNLFKHMQTHTSQRMYVCKYCNKSFTSKEYFNIHELTHTQGKIYSCDACNKSFVKKHMLDTHNQLFHSNRGYLCKYCNCVSRHKHSIRRHLELRHFDHQQEWSAPHFIDLLLAKLPQGLLLFSGDGKLSPAQQQERQKQLELLRSKHFQHKSHLNTAQVETESSTAYIYSPVSSSEAQFSQLSQVDPLVMLQSSQPLTFGESLLPEYDQAQPTVTPGCPLLVSGDLQASEGEVFFTLMDQENVHGFSTKTVTSALTSSPLESGVMSFDPGTTLMMDDGTGNGSVLLCVVETSIAEDGDSQDLAWCNDEVSGNL